MLLSLFEAMLNVVEWKVSESDAIFSKSLIGATIQDGGKRERRDAKLDVQEFYLEN